MTGKIINTDIRIIRSNIIKYQQRLNNNERVMGDKDTCK